MRREDGHACLPVLDRNSTYQAVMKVVRMNRLLGDAPLSIKIAVAVSLGQVLYIFVTTGLGVVASADKESTPVIALFYILIAVALAGGAIALLRGRRFGQPLVLVWQLFAFIIGVQTAVGGQLYIGIGAAFMSGVAVLATCAKSTVDYVTA